MEAVPVGHCDRPWNVADDPVSNLTDAIAPAARFSDIRDAETKVVRSFEAS